MRVLHFYKTAFPNSMGGIEQVIDQIARSVSQYNVESDILFLSKEFLPVTIKRNGYYLHRAKLNIEIASTGFSISAFKLFTQLAEKADLIHYHFPFPFMDLVHFITNIKKPSLLTYHSDIVRQRFLYKFYEPLQNKFLSRVDHIVTTSPNYVITSKVLKKYFNKITVIPIGLDKATYFLPDSDRLSYWSALFGIKFFFFCGVLRYYKGLHILLAAASFSNYPIVIAGTGPLELELKSKAIQLQLKNIYFLGFLTEEDKTALLTLCFAVVFPSNLRSEAFGVSLLEGAMFGKPLISCEIGTGTSFININTVTGLVVPPDDAEALSQAMKTLWENPDKASEMGKHAYERYLIHFTASDMASYYLSIYRNLIKCP